MQRKLEYNVLESEIESGGQREKERNVEREKKRLFNFFFFLALLDHVTIELYSVFYEEQLRQQVIDKIDLLYIEHDNTENLKEIHCSV